MLHCILRVLKYAKDPVIGTQVPGARLEGLEVLGRQAPQGY